MRLSLKVVFSTFAVRWVAGGGLEKWRLKLTSVKVEVEVEAELGNIKRNSRKRSKLPCNLSTSVHNNRHPTR